MDVSLWIAVQQRSGCQVDEARGLRRLRRRRLRSRDAGCLQQGLRQRTNALSPRYLVTNTFQQTAHEHFCAGTLFAVNTFSLGEKDLLAPAKPCG
jgi:hypothetical protein